MSFSLSLRIVRSGGPSRLLLSPSFQDRLVRRADGKHALLRGLRGTFAWTRSRERKRDSRGGLPGSSDSWSAAVRPGRHHDDVAAALTEGLRQGSYVVPSQSHADDCGRLIGYFARAIVCVRLPFRSDCNTPRKIPPSTRSTLICINPGRPRFAP